MYLWNGTEGRCVAATSSRAVQTVLHAQVAVMNEPRAEPPYGGNFMGFISTEQLLLRSPCKVL